MRITKEVFLNMSDMIKVSFTEEEEIKLTKDLNQMIEFIETMNEFDTNNEEQYGDYDEGYNSHVCIDHSRNN